jgi:hypothetical protein
LVNDLTIDQYRAPQNGHFCRRITLESFEVTMPHVFASTVISASVDQLWDFLRLFARVNAWHPDVTSSITDGPDLGPLVGQERTITLRDGSVIRERLLALDDVKHSYTYSVVESGLPIRAHSSTVTLFPITTHSGTFVSWTADFDSEDANAAAIANGVKDGVILAGFDGMQDHSTQRARSS